MKIEKRAITILIGLLLIMSFSFGCDSEDVQTTQTAANELAILEIDDLTAEADNVVDDILFSEGISSKSSVAEKDLDMTCKTKTVVRSENTKIITIDFGEGCESPNGNVLRGKIILTVVYDEDLKTKNLINK